ncbi:MAG: hypothetical protein EOP38_24230 [Rubrivivax sp.]|nr:MAG: hypothetical protein EOP38_24230 [Rubrivivax sp.]
MRHSPSAAILAIIATLIPTLVHAAFSLDHVAATCSATLSIQEGEELSFQCPGNLSLTGDHVGASLSGNRSITLSATGDLVLNQLSLISPDIQLRSGGALRIGQDVAFFTDQTGGLLPPTVRLTSGDVSIRPPLTPISGLIVSNQSAGGVLTWNVSPVVVPEPTVGFLALAGLGAVATRRRLTR